MISFNVWVRYFLWYFKGPLLNSTQYILPIHWKTCSLLRSDQLRVPIFTSSLVFLKHRRHHPHPQPQPQPQPLTPTSRPNPSPPPERIAPSTETTSGECDRQIKLCVDVYILLRINTKTSPLWTSKQSPTTVKPLCSEYPFQRFTLNHKHA